MINGIYKDTRTAVTGKAVEVDEDVFDGRFSPPRQVAFAGDIEWFPDGVGEFRRHISRLTFDKFFEPAAACGLGDVPDEEWEKLEPWL